MSASHTPGPWRWAPEYESVVTEDGSGGHSVVCNLLLDRHNEADGPVIAAAPDLLEACKDLLACHLLTPTDLYFAARDKALAAVKKAEGR